MQRIKEGDTVQVITGEETGEQGEVDMVLYGWHIDGKRRRTKRDPDNYRVTIRGVNIRKKHQRPLGQTRTQTGIIELEAPIHISNVMLVCPHCDEAVRIRFGFEEDKKVRICKRCNGIID